MTFQEWLQTEDGRMVSFEKMPRMLEIAYNAGAAQAEARAASAEAGWAQALAEVVALRAQNATLIAERKADQTLALMACETIDDLREQLGKVRALRQEAIDTFLFGDAP